MLYQTVEKLQEKSGSSASVIEAWNSTQAFYIQDLGKALGEYLMAERFFAFCKEVGEKSPLTGREIRKLAYLFCIDRILNYLHIYQEYYFTRAQVKELKKGFLKLCNDLKDSALNIIEAVGPPDKLTYSNIGTADGQIYSRLYSFLKSN